jgi:hypothetical protein
LRNLEVLGEKEGPMLTLFTICVDAHRHALIMAQRGWSVASSDLSLLI